MLVLGNGGAAKAVIALLEFMKAKEIILVGRTAKEGAITYEECYDSHSDGQVIINTTPLGMYPNIDAAAVDLAAFPQCTAVFDLIYNPLRTKLLQQAETLGMQAVGGLEMLVAQAVYAAEIYLNKKFDDSLIEKIYQDFLLEFKLMEFF